MFPPSFLPFAHADGQSDLAQYAISRPHPRLLLTPRRRRLLRRERERQSPRWVQFELLMKRTAPMPEPGFAHALYYAAGGDRTHGHRAIRWALEDGADLRQLALVFDWCHDLLEPAARRALSAKLEQALDGPARSRTIPAVRSRLFAAVALAGHGGDLPEAELHWVIEDWWRHDRLAALKQGRSAIPRDEIYPLLEILHAVRDNLLIDLRLDYKRYFASLPVYLLLSYYPALYPAPENDFHIPVMRNPGDPDLRIAALARAADLSLVALDPNALETQFLQGWCIQDHLMMRGPFGVTYEFLWANPYQPGLSYYNAPLSLHDPLAGRLLVRSSWDPGAAWFYLEDGVMQTFADGEIRPLDFRSFSGPMVLGDSVVLPLNEPMRFTVAADESVTYYLLGLKPHATYDIEVDDEELFEDKADAGGILVMKFPPARRAGVRLSLARPA